jgi:hypothetical protein
MKRNTRTRHDVSNKFSARLLYRPRIYVSSAFRKIIDRPIITEKTQQHYSCSL